MLRFEIVIKVSFNIFKMSTILRFHGNKNNVCHFEEMLAYLETAILIEYL